MENTNFTNNTSTDGGAVYIKSTYKLQANMCTFWENFAKQSGGAVELHDYARVVIEGCRLMANHARIRSGGALNLNNPEHVSIRDTFFLRNEALDGGAVAVIGGTYTMYNITCVDNQAAGFGGCLNINNVALTLKNSDVSENRAHYGGAGVSLQNSRIQVKEILLKLINCPK